MQIIIFYGNRRKIDIYDITFPLYNFLSILDQGSNLGKLTFIEKSFWIEDKEIDIPFIESLSNPQKQNETGNLCSQRSSRRGSDQKVVSFSFWGEMKNGYFRGILDNLAMMETHYPGWVMRLHVSSAKLTNDSVRTLWFSVMRLSAQCNVRWEPSLCP